jgi:hypothetical protein
MNQTVSVVFRGKKVAMANNTLILLAWVYVCTLQSWELGQQRGPKHEEGVV